MSNNNTNGKNYILCERVDEEDDSNAGRPPNEQFRTGRYTGYCRLRQLSSLQNDSWESDKATPSTISATNIDENDDEGNNNGDFVSFWRHNRDVVESFSSSGSDGISSRHEEDAHLRQYGQTNHTNPETGDASDRIADDDQLEPITRLSRNFSSNMFRSLSHQNFVIENDGTPHCLDRRRSKSIEAESRNAYLLLASSSTDCVMNLESTATFPIWGKQTRKEDTSVVKHDRRFCDMLSFPITRPFFSNTSKGFIDSKDVQCSSGDDLDGDNTGSNDGDFSGKDDYDAVIQSISQGMASTTNNFLLMDSYSGDNIHAWQDRNFLTQFVRRFQRIGHASIAILHNLLQKEDWSLATKLLESNPELASTWYHVDRLYDGRYGSAALPIHTACAL